MSPSYYLALASPSQVCEFFSLGARAGEKVFDRSFSHAFSHAELGRQIELLFVSMGYLTR